MDDESGDQRLEHRKEGGEEDVSLELLKSLGILYWQVKCVYVSVKMR